MNKRPQMIQAMMVLMVALLPLSACTQDTGSTAVPMPTKPVAEFATTEHPHPDPEASRYVMKCAIGLVDEDDTSYRSTYPKDADYQDIVEEMLADLNDELRDTANNQSAAEIQSHIDNFEECLHPHSEGPRFDRNCAIVAVYDEATSNMEVSYPVGEAAYQDVAREMLAELNDELRDTAKSRSAEEIQSSIDHVEECLNL